MAFEKGILTSNIELAIALQPPGLQIDRRQVIPDSPQMGQLGSIKQTEDTTIGLGTGCLQRRTRCRTREVGFVQFDDPIKQIAGSAPDDTFAGAGGERLIRLPDFLNYSCGRPEQGRKNSLLRPIRDGPARRFAKDGPTQLGAGFT